jgi:hypothetical protein
MAAKPLATPSHGGNVARLVVHRWAPNYCDHPAGGIFSAWRSCCMPLQLWELFLAARRARVPLMSPHRPPKSQRQQPRSPPAPRRRPPAPNLTRATRRHLPPRRQPRRRRHLPPRRQPRRRRHLPPRRQPPNRRPGTRRRLPPPATIRPSAWSTQSNFRIGSYGTRGLPVGVQLLALHNFSAVGVQDQPDADIVTVGFAQGLLWFRARRAWLRRQSG